MLISHYMCTTIIGFARNRVHGIYNTGPIIISGPQNMQVSSVTQKRTLNFDTCTTRPGTSPIILTDTRNRARNAAVQLQFGRIGRLVTARKV